LALKLYVEQLAKPLTSSGESERVEVEFHPDRLLSVVVQTAGGEFQLTESENGELHLHTPNGKFLIHLSTSNAFDVEIRPFGGSRAGRKRFDRDSATRNRP
jgi:hypothetical protein